jgi:CheY-like chemotaxis protein
MGKRKFGGAMSADVSAVPSRETVLVVENEVLTRHAISDYLRGCGHKVIEASTGDEALTVLQEPTLGVDVLLSAMQMPGSMDGFALARWIRANRLKVRIFLSGSHSSGVDAAAELHTVLVERHRPASRDTGKRPSRRYRRPR